MKRLFADRAIHDGSDVIRLDLPPVAENGAVVSVAVEVKSAPTLVDGITNVYIIADRNRVPVVMRVRLAPESNPAYLGTTMRLDGTGEVRVVVERTDGALLQVSRKVWVIPDDGETDAPGRRRPEGRKEG